ncbi:fructosamine kinase family protein [Nocardioides sambongensis]|uniref:fructosamine kinase family protein n=1 Tax=Nocardioides sambongensis TaxID=2589074 RepID=UPI00112807C4|nr:fructosamine kinase family protein [Nocardioides sambongensis]
MARQPVIAERAEQLLGSAVIATSPIAGGDIATAVKLRLSNGRTALLKTLTPPLPGLFEREAAGLGWLGDVGDGVAVPEVLAVAEDCLVLDWVETVRPQAEAAAGFGRALARTHAAGAPGFGAYDGNPDGYIGRLPLNNQPAATWAEFYVTRRITPYLRVARDKGLVSPADAVVVERAVERVADVVPEESPARLHGDLWNGNVLWGAGGQVFAIDPAGYGGHREVDLAMLALFGLPQLPLVLEAYTETTPLADGWEERVGFHQLFPLLVHACLFGGQYGARAATLASRYL